jgi:hypothetical protein
MRIARTTHYGGTIEKFALKLTEWPKKTFL